MKAENGFHLAERSLHTSGQQVNVEVEVSFQIFLADPVVHGNFGKSCGMRPLIPGLMKTHGNVVLDLCENICLLTLKQIDPLLQVLEASDRPDRVSLDG